MIEASPVQSGIRQDRIGGHGDTVKAVCACFLCVLFFSFRLHGLGLDEGAVIWLEELLMNECLQGHSIGFKKKWCFGKTKQKNLELFISELVSVDTCWQSGTTG